MSASNMVLHHGATFAIVTKVRIAGQWRVETLDSDTFCQTSTRRRSIRGINRTWRFTCKKSTMVTNVQLGLSKVFPGNFTFEGRVSILYFAGTGTTGTSCAS